MSDKLTNAEVAEQSAVLGAFNQILLDSQEQSQLVADAWPDGLTAWQCRLTGAGLQKLSRVAVSHLSGRGGALLNAR